MWDSEVSLENRLYGADCNGVVVTENPVWLRTHAQQPPHALITGLIAVPATYDVACSRAQTVIRQRLAVALQALRCDSNFWTAQVSDVGASAGDEMLRSQSANSAVIDPDEGRLQPGDGPVDQNIGYFSGLDLLEESQTSHWLRGRND